MTLRLEWPAEAVERVTREAQKRGLTVDEYLLQAALPPQPPSSEEIQFHERQRAAAEIRVLRKAILGPDLTIRDLIEEGRRF